MGLILASIVVLVQSSVRCSKNCQGACTAVQAWAVACSVISIVLSVLYVGLLLTQFVKYIALFLMCLWFCAVATLTYTYKDATSDLGLMLVAITGFWEPGLPSFLQLCCATWRVWEDRLRNLLLEEPALVDIPVIYIPN